MCNLKGDVIQLFRISFYALTCLSSPVSLLTLFSLPPPGSLPSSISQLVPMSPQQHLSLSTNRAC